MVVSDYELVVIGSGPAGQKGAIAAAKAGKRVALVDRPVMMGGVLIPWKFKVTAKTFNSKLRKCLLPVAREQHTARRLL
jgi:succinate dehydrogenase/fumarate reductase flavoprotein subunit